MRFDYYQPDDAWRELIAIYFRLHSVAMPISVTVPALSPNIQILLSGAVGYRFADGRCAPAPRVAILGPTVGAFGMDYAAGSEMLCVSLLPAGWRRLIGCPADALAEQVIDGEALWPASRLEALIGKLQETDDTVRRLRIIEAFLAALGRVTDRADWHHEAIDAWLEGDAGFSIDRLCGALDIGARQATRLTHQIYGISPKQLAMKYRALRGATLLTLHGALAMPEAAFGYHDQAHMIRNFNRFTGLTPGGLLRDRNNVVAMSLAGRWQAGARRPLGLWS